MKKNVFLTPIQKFVKTESFAGILLFFATIIALIWANSSYSDLYRKIWHLKLGFQMGQFVLIKPLILWINDGLMAIFFFLIGLELKRELIVGEINSLKKAAFPFLAALGGILVPIALYLLLNKQTETTNGWGIPMATDIAFALAILSLLGSRVPLSLKVFLTAFAIIDDLAAVSVIAIFYSDHLNLKLLIAGILLISFLGIWYHKQKFSLFPGLLIGLISWFLFLKAGIHPTIAGVLLAFTIPIKRRMNIDEFSAHINRITNNFTEKKHVEELLSKEELKNIEELKYTLKQVKSPLQSLEQNLHHLVAYFILPIFALANAGVEISTNVTYNFSLISSLIISLFAGKFIGVLLFSWLGLKFRITSLPKGLKFKHIIGISAIAGVGFTMSIFIANLAFKNQLLLIDSSKVGIIVGSLLAGISGYLILRFMSKTT